MKVLIINGPHEGQVYEVPDTRRAIQLTDPDQMKPRLPRFAIGPDVNLRLTTTTYSVRLVEIRCSGEPNQRYLVGQEPGDSRQPMMALLEYMVGRCYK